MPFQCDPNCGGQCCAKVECDKLVDGKCSIYDTRPLVCRVDDAYDAGMFPKYETKEDYYEANYQVCRSLGATC